MSEETPPTDSFDEDDGYTPRGGGAMGVILPIVTALVAAGAGLAIGAVAVGIMWRAAPPEEIEVVKLRDMTDEELDRMCEPFVTDTLADLTEAQAKVTSLNTEVEAKTQRVNELEEAMKRGAVAGRKLREELAQAKKELEEVKAELAIAIEEKEEALQQLEETVTQLRATEEELVDTKERLVVAEEDVLAKRWKSFKQTAQLEVCEKGGRRKMGKCRETVLASLDGEVEKKFRHCVKSGQAVPGLFEADRKMERLPDYSSYLNQDERVVKDWYVTLCDPTLPEAEDFTAAIKAVQAAEAAGASAGGGVKTLDEQLEDVLPDAPGE